MFALSWILAFMYLVLGTPSHGNNVTLDYRFPTNTYATIAPNEPITESTFSPEESGEFSANLAEIVIGYNADNTTVVFNRTIGWIWYPVTNPELKAREIALVANANWDVPHAPESRPDLAEVCADYDHDSDGNPIAGSGHNWRVEFADEDGSVCDGHPSDLIRVN